MTLPDRTFSLAPEAARKQSEVTFGERLEVLVHRAHAKPVDVARLLGFKKTTKLYAAFRGVFHFRAAWLECLPPAVERLYLDARAQHHAMRLAPIGDPESPQRTFHALVRELGDVTRVASASEEDGTISVDEALAELREITEAETALADRKAYLHAVVRARGALVLQPRPPTRSR